MRACYKGSMSASLSEEPTRGTEPGGETRRPLVEATRAVSEEDGLRVFAEEVRKGLSRTDQKELPARYLYDNLGSVLFEAITFLPEYGVTRADERMLVEVATELPPYLPPGITVAELGSGSGRKTRTILQAVGNGVRPRYYPIDISDGALERCRAELDEIADVRTYHNTYVAGLRQMTADRPASQPVLLLFLGSNIGNFDRVGADAFLSSVRRSLRPRDLLLLGADLLKPVDVLIAAYDDPTGVTAAFNLNLLGRINRELGGNFDLRRFRHEARYNEEQHRIEMHLRSLCDQEVRIEGAHFCCRLAKDETIWTEASHKFTVEELQAMARRCGFRPLADWVDEEWPFAESLWMVEAEEQSPA